MEKRHTKFPPQRQELFYYDENDGRYKPITNDDGMIPVQSVQKKWKDSFSQTTLNPEKWEVIQVGEGQNIDASLPGNTLISTGVTPNAETIILSRESFTVPMRGLFGFQISQKIANQDFYLEFVSVDKVTKVPDDLHKVAWKISGTDSVTTTNARTVTQTGGMVLVESANLSVSVAQTTSALYELELFADEAWYHTRTMDSTAGRSYSAVRHNNIPDPNGLYKMQIRVKNGAVAPASSTNLQLNFVNVVDYAELTAEITSGRGSASAGQALSVNAAGGTISTVTTLTTGNMVSKTLGGTITTSAITTSTPFTTPAIDNGSALTYSTLRGRFTFDQPVKVEFFHGSNTTATSNRIQSTHVIPANTTTIIDFPLLARYMFVRITNTGTATTTVHEAIYALKGL